MAHLYYRLSDILARTFQVNTTLHHQVIYYAHLVYCIWRCWQPWIMRMGWYITPDCRLFFTWCFLYNTSLLGIMLHSKAGFTTVHYSDVIMGNMAYQINRLMIVNSTVHSGADQRNHQSSVSLAFVRGIHRWPVTSPHNWPVTRKMFPFDDAIMEDDLSPLHVKND